MLEANQRTSFGGQIVAESLWAAGFQPETTGTSLIETARPQKYRAVLLQSAWNVLPRPEFTAMLRPYPASMRRRAWARRLVSHVNLKRAERVVCLTEAVAQLLRNTLGIQPVVAPVTAPLHDWRQPRTSSGSVQRADIPFALVPGTLTWFKRPMAALDVLRDEPSFSNIREVRFCGRDDRSGCWPAVKLEAERRGVEVSLRVVNHSDLYDLYAHADVAVLPSSLESLGFGLSEALLHSRKVVASPIPAHVEVATRLGVQPIWLGEHQVRTRPEVRAALALGDVKWEWEQVAQALGLNLRSPS